MKILLEMAQECLKDANSTIQEIRTLEEVFRKNGGEIRKLTGEILENLYNERDRDVKQAKFYRTLYNKIKRSQELSTATTENH